RRSAERRHKSRRRAASGTAPVRSVVRRLPHQRATHEPALWAGAVEGIARRTSRRDARGHQQRHAAHAWLQASFRARRDRRNRRLPQDRAAAATGPRTAALRMPSTENAMSNARRLTLAGLAVSTALALASAPAPAHADDVAFAGTVKSAAGEAMGGVTVSAKADGQTITTSVFSDETGG